MHSKATTSASYSTRAEPYKHSANLNPIAPKESRNVRGHLNPDERIRHLLDGLLFAIDLGFVEWYSFTIMWRRIAPRASDHEIRVMQSRLLHLMQRFLARRAVPTAAAWCLEKTRKWGTHGHLLVAAPHRFDDVFKAQVARSLAEHCQGILPPRALNWDGRHHGHVWTRDALLGKGRYMLKAVAGRSERCGVRPAMGHLNVDAKAYGMTRNIDRAARRVAGWMPSSGTSTAGG
jgi:hypothetical protein